MNDFTKEELYDLQSWGDAYTAFDIENDIYKMHEPLLTKIQSMIDNYCEHECNGEVEIFIDTCKKCNAYLLRETHYE